MPQIFVGNLPYDACESDLRYRFEPFGRVNSVRIVTDASTNRPRGFAFVNMPSSDDAEEAVARLCGSSLGGRQLTINESNGSPYGSASGSSPSKGAPTTNRLMQLFKEIQEEE